MAGLGAYTDLLRDSGGAGVGGVGVTSAQDTFHDLLTHLQETKRQRRSIAATSAGKSIEPPRPPHERRRVARQYQAALEDLECGLLRLRELRPLAQYAPEGCHWHGPSRLALESGGLLAPGSLFETVVWLAEEGAFGPSDPEDYSE